MLHLFLLKLCQITPNNDHLGPVIWTHMTNDNKYEQQKENLMYLSRLPILFYNLVNVNLFFTNNLCFHIGTYIRVWNDKTTIEEEIIGWICENYRNISEYTVDMTQRKRYYTCYGPSIKYFNGFVAIGYAMCVKEHILLGSKTVVRATTRVRGF